jgi:hypothetical protein
MTQLIIAPLNASKKIPSNVLELSLELSSFEDKAATAKDNLPGRGDPDSISTRTVSVFTTGG